MKTCPKCGIQCSNELEACPYDGAHLVVSPSEARELPGELFDFRYSLQNKLGQTSVTTVYKAEDTNDGSTVVVKQLRPYGERDIFDVEFLERFRAIAENLSRIKAANLVPLKSFCIADGRAYLVYPFIEGTPLNVVLQQEGALPRERVLGYAEQICVAVAQLHDFGVLHRDLTPASIFLRKNKDGSEDAIVLNYGITRILGRTNDAAMTIDGKILGNPRYMAPEQLQAQPVDPRTDVYSLGVIFYEMLVGQSPFPAASLVDLLHSILTQDPTPIPASIAAEPMVNALYRSMDRSPSHRFHDPLQLLAQMKNLATHTELQYNGVATDSGEIANILSSQQVEAEDNFPVAPEKEELLFSRNKNYALDSSNIERSPNEIELEGEALKLSPWKNPVFWLLLLGFVIAAIAYDQLGEGATERSVQQLEQTEPAESSPKMEMGSLKNTPSSTAEPAGSNAVEQELIPENLPFQELAQETPIPNLPAQPAALPSPPTRSMEVNTIQSNEEKTFAEFTLTKGWYVQIGAKQTEAEASELKIKLERTGRQTHIESATVNGIFYYRIVVGPFDSRSAAVQVKTEITNQKLVEDSSYLRLVD